MKTKEELENWKKEYLALCKKYKVFIHGCGCCDSPYLIRTTFDKFYLNHEEECLPGIDEKEIYERRGEDD